MGLAFGPHSLYIKRANEVAWLAWLRSPRPGWLKRISEWKDKKVTGLGQLVSHLSQERRVHPGFKQHHWNWPVLME